MITCFEGQTLDTPDGEHDENYDKSQ